MTTTACTSNCIYVKLSVKWCHCSLWKVSCIRNIWQTSLFSSQRMINWSMQSEVPGVKRRWDEDIVILLTCVCVFIVLIYCTTTNWLPYYHVCYWAIVTTVITSLYQVARCGQWGWWPWPGVLLVTGWSRTWSLLPTASLSYLLSISVPAISQQFVSSDDNTTQNIFKNINGSVNSYLVKCAVKLVR